MTPKVFNSHNIKHRNIAYLDSPLLVNRVFIIFKLNLFFAINYLRAHVQFDIHLTVIFSLHICQAPNTQLACSRTVCMGSVMSGGNFPNASNEPRKPDTLLEHAKHFLDQYYTSIRRYMNTYDGLWKIKKHEIIQSGL